jgi:hypothetical protein
MQYNSLKMRVISIIFVEVHEFSNFFRDPDSEEGNSKPKQNMKMG